MADVVLMEVADRVATVTLNRPKARNAMSVELIDLLRRLVAEADARSDVDVIILTGTDPAFCAGLDLKELGRDGGALKKADPIRPTTAPSDGSDARRQARGANLPTAKPVIGAINGVTVTGGLELALNCDFLVASDRARFADTHSRVGVHPLWGLTVTLPQAIGLRRAREMSATGNFVDARQAFQWGLVNHVVDHAELLPFCQRLAADIVSSDQRALTAVLATYEEVSRGTGAAAHSVEIRRAAEFQQGGVDPADIERRRQSVVDRGRSQVS